MDVGDEVRKMVMREVNPEEISDKQPSDSAGNWIPMKIGGDFLTRIDGKIYRFEKVVPCRGYSVSNFQHYGKMCGPIRADL